jgi:hypothetical protein
MDSDSEEDSDAEAAGDGGAQQQQGAAPADTPPQADGSEAGGAARGAKRAREEGGEPAQRQVRAAGEPLGACGTHPGPCTEACAGHEGSKRLRSQAGTQQAGAEVRLAAMPAGHCTRAWSAWQPALLCHG